MHRIVLLSLFLFLQTSLLQAGSRLLPLGKTGAQVTVPEGWQAVAGDGRSQALLQIMAPGGALGIHLNVLRLQPGPEESLLAGLRMILDNMEKGYGATPQGFRRVNAFEQTQDGRLVMSRSLRAQTVPITLHFFAFHHGQDACLSWITVHDSASKLVTAAADIVMSLRHPLQPAKDAAPPPPPPPPWH